MALSWFASATYAPHTTIGALRLLQILYQSDSDYSWICGVRLQSVVYTPQYVITIGSSGDVSLLTNGLQGLVHLVKWWQDKMTRSHFPSHDINDQQCKSMLQFFPVRPASSYKTPNMVVSEFCIPGRIVVCNSQYEGLRITYHDGCPTKQFAISTHEH